MHAELEIWPSDWRGRQIGKSDLSSVHKVGIFASRGIDACVAMMGACWAGAAYVPIGLKLPQEKILAILATCELTAIIADEEGAKLLTDTVLAACPKTLIRVDQVMLEVDDNVSSSGHIDLSLQS